MKKNLIFLCVFFSLIFSLVFASAVSIGTFKQNQDVEIYQTCNNCTYCNFTTIKYPNGTNILTNIEATEDNTYYYSNILKGNISELGVYSYTYKCGNAQEDITGTLEFEITATGKLFGSEDGSVAVAILLGALGLAFLFLILGFKLSDNPKFIPISFFFIVLAIILGVYSLNLGWAFTHDILQYESLSDVSERIYISVLWLVTGMSVISMTLMLISFIKELGKTSKKKQFGEDFNPITDNYE